MVDTSRNSVTVHWKGHAETLHQGLWESFKHDWLVDTNVSFYGDCVKVHRLVLSVFLPNYRRSALDGHGQELNLDYVANQSEDIRSLVEFAYTGRVTIPEDRLHSLRRLAEDLGFKGLAGTIVDCESRDHSTPDKPANIPKEIFNDSTAEESAGMEDRAKVPDCTSDDPGGSDSTRKDTCKKDAPTSKQGSSPNSLETLDQTPGVTFEDEDNDQNADDDEQDSDFDCSLSDGDFEEEEEEDDALDFESYAESVDGLRASPRRSMGKRSTRWLRPNLKCPHCVYNTTNDALLINHLSEHYTNASKPSEVDDTVQTTRRRTRSQDVGATTTSPSALRPITTRSKAAAAAAAAAIAADAAAREQKVPDAGEDQEKKRLRAEYQRNYRLARKLVKCSQCGYETRDPTALKAHRATHASPDTRQISCDKCQKTFLTLQALRFHERTKCGQERRFTCDFCGHRTLHRETWRQHLANIHKRDTRGNPLGDDIKCPQCDYVCCARHQLQLHLLRKHTVDKPFKCDKCEYAAVRRSELAKHVSIQHLKERNFMCDVCGFRSQTSNGLYSHVRSKHSGIKLYRCDLCGKEYNCHTSFKVHKQKHTGDVKLYVCHVCGHSCNKRTNLRSHMRRIHSVELESLKKNYAPRECPHSTEPNCEVQIVEAKVEQVDDVSVARVMDVTEHDPNVDAQMRHEIGSEFVAEPTDLVNSASMSTDVNMIAVGVNILGSMFTRMVAGDDPALPL